jgi:glycerol-3-phosphate dehydrogenase (NAD(P)+)
MQLETVGIVGGGAWGTALAVTAQRAGRKPLIWAYEPETIREINDQHQNHLFLPGVNLDPAIRATGHLSEIAECDCVLMVTPAQHMREIAGELASHLGGQPVVVCSKGIEQQTGRLLAQILEESLPADSIAVLSGPGFAAEVARGLPAAVTLASRLEKHGEALAHALSHHAFRIYWSGDVVGAQIGAAVKNVLAIAAGIVLGKKLGSSAHAALTTRGFAEMVRLGEALGAKRDTLSGLSGLGDLILTCGSYQSRNTSLGVALGEGRTLKEVLGHRRSVSEGVYTATAVAQLAAERGVDMPICEAVHRVVSDQATVDEAIEWLLSRPLRAEV